MVATLGQIKAAWYCTVQDMVIWNQKWPGYPFLWSHPIRPIHDMLFKKWPPYSVAIVMCLTWGTTWQLEVVGDEASYSGICAWGKLPKTLLFQFGDHNSSRIVQFAQGVLTAEDHWAHKPRKPEILTKCQWTFHVPSNTHSYARVSFVFPSLLGMLIIDSYSMLQLTFTFFGTCRHI